MHLKKGELRAFLSHELGEKQIEQMREHLSGCLSCQLSLRAMEERTRTISSLLDPSGLRPEMSSIAVERAYREFQGRRRGLFQAFASNVGSRARAVPTWAWMGVLCAALLAAAVVIPEIGSLLNKGLGVPGEDGDTGIIGAPEERPESGGAPDRPGAGLPLVDKERGHGGVQPEDRGGVRPNEEASGVYPKQPPSSGIPSSPARLPAASIDLPAYSLRVVIGEGGSYFVLPVREDHIYIYSRKGLVSSIPIPRLVGHVQVKTVSDFAVDSKGEFHVLASVVFPRADQTRPEAAILRFDRFHGRVEVISLRKPLQAWRFDLDGDGNYYLLGIEDDVYWSFLNRGSHEGGISLVHKFASDGSLLSSFLEVPSPASRSIFESDILDPLMERNQFRVTVEGEAALLLIRKPPEAEPWEWTRTLYVCDGDGRTDVRDPVPPSERSFMYSLQKAGSLLVVEWADRALSSRRVLTHLDGGIVWRSDSLAGRIVAIGDFEVLIETSISGAFEVSFFDFALNDFGRSSTR
jgi:hypothetical protein